MNTESTAERPIESNRHLSPFGVGGDYIGARRSRRAFRLLVIAVAAVTFSLYYVEHYLRYDLNEVHYRMALTLEDDSQRAILRNVVRRDAEDSEVPTAKYVEALAHIEEDDVILERFAEAVKLAPDKGALLITYGCKLFQRSRYQDARQVFRDATLKTTRNALPRYLQAAALAASSDTEEDFRTALAQVGRANESGEVVAFPQPLWHESLPKSGNWYVSLRRRLADQCCAPLFHLKNVITRRALEQEGEGEVQGWDTWLAQLQVMGEHLVGSSASEAENLGTSQAIYGLQIQKDVIAMRIRLAEQAGNAPDAALIERRIRLEEAMGRVQRFETNREEAVAAAEARLQQPIRLGLIGFLLLFFARVFSWLLLRVLGSDKNARTVPHHRFASRGAAGWAVALLLTLVLLSAGPAGETAFGAVVGAMWYGWLALAMLVAMGYPAAVLPGATEVCAPLATEPHYDDKVIQARSCRRRAYVSLSARYMGLLLGLYTLSLCIWFVAFRIGTGLYPTDIKLLLPGLEQSELQLVQSVQTFLQG